MYVIYQLYWSGNKKIFWGILDDNRLIIFIYIIYNIRILFEGIIKKRSRGKLYYIVELYIMYVDVKLFIKLILIKFLFFLEFCSVYDYIMLIIISIDIVVLLFFQCVCLVGID